MIFRMYYILIFLVVMSSGCKQKQIKVIKEEPIVQEKVITETLSIDKEFEAKESVSISKNVEACLLEKYGEIFVCEVSWYWEELDRMHRIEAYPKSNPKIKFKVLDGRLGSDRSYPYIDFYFNELCREQINQYIYQVIQPYYPDCTINVTLNYPIKNQVIDPETFSNIPIRIQIYIQEETDVDIIRELFYQMCTEIYQKVQSQEHIYIDIIQENKNVKEITIFYEEDFINIYMDNGYTKVKLRE